MGEVGGGGWIYPALAPTRVEWRAGLRGCGPPRAAWGGISEGIQGRWRRTQTKPERGRCGGQAARGLRAGFAWGCWAEGSRGVGVGGSRSGEPGAGKEADFAGALDASDAAHVGARAMRAGERRRVGAWGRLGGKAQRRGDQSGSGLGHAPVAAIVPEQAVVADFGEAPGEQMEAQTADELDAGQGEGFEAVERACQGAANHACVIAPAAARDSRAPVASRKWVSTSIQRPGICGRTLSPAR